MPLSKLLWPILSPSTSLEAHTKNSAAKAPWPRPSRTPFSASSSGQSEDPMEGLHDLVAGGRGRLKEKKAALHSHLMMPVWVLFFALDDERHWFPRPDVPRARVLGQEPHGVHLVRLLRALHRPPNGPDALAEAGRRRPPPTRATRDDSPRFKVA